MANAPDLSLRGAKRRGNLAVLCWISRKLRRKRNCFPEIAPQGHFLALRAQGATAPSGPRNDKSGSIAPLNSCHQYCQPAWRSLSAATDAIGRCVFIGTLYELEVPSRDCHVASLLAMTRQGSAAMGTVRHTESAVLLPLRGRAGHAPPLQGQCGLNGGRCESAMPSRDCHVASLLAMTRQAGTVVHQRPPAV